MPSGNLHQDKIVYAFVLVILLYLLAQPMGLDANDRIRLWVEIRLAAECLYPNRVFLEHFRVPGTRSCAQDSQQLLKGQGVTQSIGMENTLQLLPNLLDGKLFRLRSGR